MIDESPLLIEAKGIRRQFDDGTLALDGMSLEVPVGGFISLLGPSGCGKSTVLRLLAGLDRPSDGTLNWPGGKPGRGEIGYVFQEATLLPWATVWENIYLPLRIAGQSREASAPDIDAVIRLVGLDGFEHAKSHQLSGGMRMRTSVARALVTKPRLLLMDEPFAALDEITRFQLNDDLLRIFLQEGCTIVFVTHSVFEAVYLSQRVCVMAPRPGRVVAAHDIDLPWPRDAALRTSMAFGTACRSITQDLGAPVA